MAPVTVTISLLVEPVNTGIPVKFAPLPTKLVAVTTPAEPAFIFDPTLS